MGVKKMIVGLAVLAGAGVYLVNQPSLMADGTHAWRQLVSAVDPGRYAAQTAQHSTDGSTRAQSSKPGSQGGVKRTQIAVSSGTPKSSTTSATPSTPPITADNAPPATPITMDGVYVKYDPYKPSGGPYPQLPTQGKLWIDVSISQQLIYIFNGNQRLYTMATSSGLDTNSDNGTPLGVYHVQAEKGTWFYSSQYQEGAQYWVSWLDHGIFLFHSVPENINHQVIPSVAAALGVHRASHGCFHLTIPDAQWVYNNIPQGTPIVVEQAPVRLQGNLLYQPSSQQATAITGSSVAAGAVNVSASTNTTSGSTS